MLCTHAKTLRAVQTLLVLIVVMLSLTGCTASCLTMQEVSLSNVRTSFRRLLFLSPDEGWAIGYINPYLLHYLKGKWSGSPIPNTMSAIAKVNNTELWGVGSDNYKLHYQSGCWQEDGSLVNRNPLNDISSTLSGVSMLSSNQGVAVGSDGLVAVYKDGNWSRINNIPDSLRGSSFHDVYMLSATEWWTADSGATVSHYKDGNWQTIAWAQPGEISQNNQGYYPNMNRIQMLSADEGWAVGESGIIVHYSGGKWKKAASPTAKDISDIHMLSADEGWAASGDGILHYSNGKWEIQDSRPVSTLYMLSNDDGWAIGTSILHYSKGRWQEVEKLGGQ